MSNHSNAAETPNPESNPPPPPDLQVVPPPAAPPAADAVPVKHPGKFNKKQLAEISKLEVLIPICREPGATGPLDSRGVTETFLGEAEGHIAATRTDSTTAVNCTIGGKAATLDVGAAKAELMESLRAFQAAGRLKFEQTDPTMLERYLIGERINQSRAILEQSGQTIIDNTNADRPPSIDTSMITAATGKLDLYTESPQPQADEKAAASAAREARNALVLQVIIDRQKIQMAAESAWPHTNPANAGWRMKFRLPRHQPYKP